MLKGKVAVITGGSRGIGFTVAQKMAENHADIALIDVGNIENTQASCDMLKVFGVTARPYKCDVSGFAAVKATVAQIAKDFGTIDILVNNAGITRDSLIFSMSEENWDAVIKHYGKIINVSSIAGLMGNAGQVNYSASKAGIIGVTKTIARELGARGICCNAVAPGVIDTDMTKDLPGRDKLIDSVPMKKAGKPEDVANLVLFLASPVSDYITGEVIRVDGGMAM